jgi:putative phage-type endonuclease
MNEILFDEFKSFLIQKSKSLPFIKKIKNKLFNKNIDNAEITIQNHLESILNIDKDKFLSLFDVDVDYQKKKDDLNFLNPEKTSMENVNYNNNTLYHQYQNKEDIQENSDNQPNHLEDKDIEIDEIRRKKNEIAIQIEKLKNVYQPKQRTEEWYSFRNNLITASNAFKAFGSEKIKNQLIFEKCKQENHFSFKTNIHSSFHWGQKYEPLSVLLYEKKNNTEISDFGCIQHEQYSYLGASPDGINTDYSSDKFGTMLEIKNVFTRVINGEIKKEYWIQMQLQMEICNLNECDFLETKFIEYKTEEDFLKDSFSLESKWTTSLDKKEKGMGIFFYDQKNTPQYFFQPLHLIEDDSIQHWKNEIISKYTNTPYLYHFETIFYWKNEIYLCQHVKRNKKWFENNVDSLKEIWNTILHERVHGYKHREPTKRIVHVPKCLIQVIKK